MTKTVLNSIKLRPTVGANVMSASEESDLYVDGMDIQTVDSMLASIAGGGGADLVAARQGFAAAMLEPIMQIVPYVTLYDRFFMNQTIDLGADNAIPVEDHLVSVAYSSHPQTGIQYVTPGYLFTRPSFSTYTTGVKMPWNLMGHAGWNVLSRQMNYAVWEMAKKRDAAAKTVLDAAIPTSHKLTVTGGWTKASVDEVIKRSNQIGFPVKQVVINPGVLMQMQSWTWGGTGFFISPEKSNEIIDNLYLGNYGGLKWFASPYASTSTIYFGGDPTQIGYHQTKGTPRNDSAVDIDLGIDKYTLRDAYHSYYVQATLSLWTIALA